MVGNLFLLGLSKRDGALGVGVGVGAWNPEKVRAYFVPPSAYSFVVLYHVRF